MFLFQSEALQINMKYHALNILGFLKCFDSYKKGLDLVDMLLHDEYYSGLA